MVKIIFVRSDQSRWEVESAAGISIMQLARINGIDEILGECGGSAMCATCHVYVDAAFADKLPSVSAVEHEMLESTACERRTDSRLGCQVTVTEEIDGIVLRLPERQT